MIYKNLEVKRRNYKKILLNILVIILLLTSIIYIYISNNSINSNTRRKINEIEKDVSQLYNYTETMSDFIVDNYKPPEINLKTLFEDIYKNQLDLKKDNEILKNTFEEFKNQSLRNHLELKKEIENNKIRTNNFLRIKAIEHLRNIGIHKDLYGSYIHYIYHSKIENDNYKKIIENIDNNHKKYFEELLNIDYDNFIVSFAYFSENPEINYNINPIYKNIINETLYYDNSKITHFSSGKYILNVYNYKYIQIFSVSPQKFM